MATINSLLLELAKIDKIITIRKKTTILAKIGSDLCSGQCWHYRMALAC